MYIQLNIIYLKGVINMAQINIRIDDNLKEQAEILFEELGLNMSTAFNVFIRQSIRQGGIPFEITTQVDPFFNESNMKILQESLKEANEGRFVSKSLGIEGNGAMKINFTEIAWKDYIYWQGQDKKTIKQ